MVANPNYQKPDIKTTWSDDDNCYLTKSAEYDIIGIGKTEDESVGIFYELLEDHFQAEKEDRIIKHKAGRPRKNNVKLSANVKFDTKVFLEVEAVEQNKNIGAIIDEIVEFYIQYNPDKGHVS